MRSRSSLAGTAMVVLAASAWGTWSLFIRPSGADHATAAGVPLLLMGALALPLAWLDRRDIQWDRRTIALTLAIGVLAGINLLTFFAAMQLTTVAIAVLTHYAAPLLVALLAGRIEGETVPGALPASALGLVGIGLLLAPGLEPGRDLGSPWLGAMLGFTSAVAYALLLFGVRRVAPRIGDARAICAQGLIGGALLTLVAIPGLSELDVRGLSYLALGALGPGLLASLLFIRGLGIIGSPRAAVLAFAEPVCAVAIGWLYWAEALAAPAALGALCVVAAGVWVSRSPAGTTPA